MASIIRELPYFERVTGIQVHRQSFSVKRDQIVLWISISEKGVERLRAWTPRIPAILDTGCNHNLLISQQHFSQWAGLHPDYLPKLPDVRVSGRRVSQFAANVWLHANVAGQRDRPAARDPFQLALVPGIAVQPARHGEPVRPRLPLLGLRAFQRAGLQIGIDCHRRRVNIRTRRRFWSFG